MMLRSLELGRPSCLLGWVIRLLISLPKWLEMESIIHAQMNTIWAETEPLLSLS